MKQYRILYEIKLKHEYYSSGDKEMGDLEIVPTNSCLTVLKNYRMIFKTATNKIQIICEYDNSEPFIPITTPIRFSFFLNQKNPLFLNFTELPFLKNKYKNFYFSNKSCKFVSEEQAICEQDYISDKDLCNRYPFGFSKDYRGNLTLIDNDSNIVFDYAKVDISKKDLIKAIVSNNNGKYFLKQDKQTLSEFIIARSEKRSTIGLIEIILEPKAIEFINKKDDNKLEYILPFKPRASHWQYVVTKKVNELKNIKIIDDNENIVFKPIKSEDESKRVFVSDQKILLKRNNNYTFKLINKNGNSKFNRTFYEQLPYPSVKNLFTDEDDNSKLVSKIFVHV